MNKWSYDHAIWDLEVFWCEKSKNNNKKYTSSNDIDYFCFPLFVQFHDKKKGLTKRFCLRKDFHPNFACWIKLCATIIEFSLLDHLKFKLENKAFFNCFIWLRNIIKLTIRNLIHAPTSWDRHWNCTEYTLHWYKTSVWVSRPLQVFLWSLRM